MIKNETLTYDQLQRKYNRALRKWGKTHDGCRCTIENGFPEDLHNLYENHPQTKINRKNHERWVYECNN